MTVEVGWLIPLASLILGWLGYQLSKSKDLKKDGVDSGKLEERLVNISNGITEIRVDIKANERRLVEHGERLTRVEESTKQAHKRIDSIEGGKE